MMGLVAAVNDEPGADPSLIIASRQLFALRFPQGMCWE